MRLLSSIDGGEPENEVTSVSSIMCICPTILCTAQISLIPRPHPLMKKNGLAEQIG